MAAWDGIKHKISAEADGCGTCTTCEPEERKHVKKHARL